MNCKIIYNQNQEPIGVLDDNGTPSQTFQQILSNPNIKDFDQALEVYKGMLSKQPRVADKLPLNLSVFNTNQFTEMKGKMVNPVSVQQMLNGAGIKQIEKDLINQVIEDNYKGQKRISYDELEATVRANLMPLERITTSSYADYGMDNLGSGNYGEAKTIILNAPIEHGVTGHFSGDFKASGRQNIKYVPKQLNDNVWVAVEDGYESQANDNNIYQYVGTAGTKEAVDAWIENYNGIKNIKIEKDIDVRYEDSRGKLRDARVVSVIDDTVKVYNLSDGEYYQGNISEFRPIGLDAVQEVNKGMFGHIRVWQDGQDYYVAELQSDYFQKNNARKQIESKLKDKLRENKNLYTYETLINYLKNLPTVTKESLTEVDEEFGGQPTYNTFNEYEKIIIDRLPNNKPLLEILEKEYIIEKNKELEKILSQQEKQFIASQKIWEQRMVREAIKEASLSGATSLRFPTPYTLSVIEGYVSTDSEERLPYQVVSAENSNNLQKGDTINYLGKDLIVYEATENSIKVVPIESDITDEIVEDLKTSKDSQAFLEKNKLSDKRYFYKGVILPIGVLYLEMKEVPKNFNEDSDYFSIFEETTITNYFDKYRQEIENFTGQTFTEKEWKELIEDSDGTFIQERVHTTLENATKDMNSTGVPNVNYTPTQEEIENYATNYTDQYAIINGRVFDISEKETLSQPSSYEVVKKDRFDIETTLDRTQRTVAYKYLEIAEILKKEKPVEIVTDENGFDWYEAPITEADTQTPVVAFSLQQQEPSLKYKVNNSVHNSFAEALRASTSEKIEAGVNTVDGFQTLFTVDSNTNQSTHIGFINAMIKGGLLNGEVDQDGNLKPEGQSFAKKTINGYSVKELYQKQFGIKTAKLNFDGSISLFPENARTKIQITLKNGEKKTINLTDLNKPFKELKKQYDVETTSAILANKELKDFYSKTETTKNYETIVPENELQEKALAFLNKLGFKTLSIVDYLNNYSFRNKKTASASALIDLANKVVAFKDGVVTEEDLLEEVSHLIESSISQEQKENILRNIHKTQEWMEFYDLYKDAYETEEDLRREILGKLIAKGLKTNFEARNQNSTEDTILARLKELFDSIIERVRAFFKPQYQNELDSLNKEIYKRLMQEELSEGIDNSTGVFFNLNDASKEANSIFNKTDTLKKSAEKLLNQLEEQDRNASKKFKNPTDKASIESAKRSLDDAEVLKGFATLVRVASSQTESLTKASEAKGVFSAEENTTYQNLVRRVLPSLQEAKAYLKDNTNKLHVELKAEIDKIAVKAGNLTSAVQEGIQKRFGEIVEEIISKNEIKGTTDEALYRETIENALRTVQKDTDFIHAHLGSLFQSRNPLLNIAGDIIERTNLQSIENFQSPAKKLTNTLSDLGMLGQKSLKPLYDKFGIINQIDKEKEDKYNFERKKEILYNLFERRKAIFPDSVEDLTLLDSITSGKVEDLDVVIASLSQEDLNKFNIDWSNEISSRYIPRVKKEFTDKLENTVVEINGQKYAIKADLLNNIININDNAIQIDRSFQAEKSVVYNNTESDLLTLSEQAKIQEINRRRFEASNPRNEDGTFIPGLTEVYSEQYGKYITVVDEQELVKLRPQEKQRALTVFGLQTLALIKQKAYKEFNEGKEPTEKFIQEFENAQDPVAFLQNNAFVSFPDSYYESFKNSDGIVDRLRELQTREAQDLIDEIRKKRGIINNILRQHAIYNSPGDTNFSEMSAINMKDVEFAQRDLEELYLKAKKILPKAEQNYDIDAESIPNKAYFDYIKDAKLTTLEERLFFIKKHTTPQGRRNIEDMEAIINNNLKIPSYYSNYISATMSQEEKLEALEKFAQSKLLPYLKKLEPMGYSEVMKAFENKEITPRELVENYKNIVKISPSPDYYEGTKFDNVNPIWRRNKENGVEQYTQEYLQKVGNTKYFEMFDIDPQTNQPRSNKNENLWKARKALLEAMDTAIEYNNKTGIRNRYMTPQIRKRTIERVFNPNIKETKEAIKDALQFRPEEMELGNPNNIYSIPVYYDSPLENKEELTENYLYATLLYLQTASLHKARRENLNDMLVVEGALLATNTENKASDATNTYRMFKNFMEYNFFGVKETVDTKILDGRVDVGKVLKTLNNFAKKLNLQGITVPITSMLQSGTQKFMERVIGETINPIAANTGDKLFAKMYSDAAKEVMRFQSKAPLNVIMEALGLYNMVHRYEDSQYSKAGRLALNGSSKLHELGNFPVIPRGVLGIIADYRIVDGKVISFNQFKKKAKETRQWTDFAEFHPVFFSAVKDGVLDFKNEEFLEIARKAGITPHEGQTLSEYLEGKKEIISKRSLAFTQRIDSQIPQHQRSAASRHAVMNFFLSHMNWLLTAIPNKLKQKHFNLSEEMNQQEGSWRTTANFIGKILMNPKQIKEVYSQLENYQKTNLKRTAIELGFANALAVLAIILAGFNDDDEDPNYALAVADMFASRLAVEQISSTVGLPSGVMDALGSPAMLKRKVEDWAKVTAFINEDGTDAERNKFLKSVVPYYNDIVRWSDPHQTRINYMYHGEFKKGLFDNYAWLSNIVDEE